MSAYWDAPRDTLLDKLVGMLLIRRFEERLIAMSEDGLLRGGVFHVYIGQEVTGVVALQLLRRSDVSFTTHRNHGHLIARGADPGRVFAEILGRATGYNRGKGGTFHVAARECGFPHTSAIVGGVHPIATGAALAAKHRGTDEIAVCLFGDGSMEEGAFSEAINMAKLWTLPVVYLCENNGVGITGSARGAPASVITAASLCDIPNAYRLPTLSVDGSDAAAVHAAMSEAIERARSQGGPTFIEAKTLRWPGSRVSPPKLVPCETDVAMAWDTSLRTGDHSAWHDADPLLTYIGDLIARGVATQADVRDADMRVRQRIADAARFAIDSPLPELSAAFEDVFVSQRSAS